MQITSAGVLQGDGSVHNEVLQSRKGVLCIRDAQASEMQQLRAKLC